MSLRSAVLVAGAAGLLLSAAGAVRAQAAKPEPAKAEAAKPESAEAAAAAAMDRAQRMAANPMKVIMQASKIRRRPDADPVPEPARIAARPVAAVPGAGLSRAAAPAAASAVLAPAAVSAAPPARTAAPVPSPALVEVAAAEPVVEPAASPLVTPAAKAAVGPAATLAAPSAAAPVVVPVVAPLTAPSPAPVTAPLIPPATAPATAPLGAQGAESIFAVAPVVQPKLMTMIEPDIPARLLAEGPRIVEVFADLALRADGTVAGVKLLPGVPRTWQRYLTVALERWRFEPLQTARVHRVQLVFGE